MKETDQHREKVLAKIATGNNPRKIGGVSYDIAGKTFHIKVVTGKKKKYPFNINDTVLKADYEVYVCGTSDLFFVVPISIVKMMHEDPNSMPDYTYPGYTVVDVHPMENKIIYGTKGKAIDIGMYRNATLKIVEDNTPYNKKYGGGGEGEDHKRLKEWVANNPEFLNLYDVEGVEVESHIFPSNDLPDIVFRCRNKHVSVEIETDTPLPGAYQAVKYKALLCAELGVPCTSQKVETTLVAWRIPPEIREFCSRNGIAFFEKMI
jgi:hypothetical protein